MAISLMRGSASALASVGARSYEQTVGAGVAADQHLVGEAGRRFEPLLEARGERVKFGARGADEDGEARKAVVAIEQRGRHPQLRQAADGHRIAEKIDADLAAAMIAGKAREMVVGVRELGAIECFTAVVQHAAAGSLGGAAVAHADNGEGRKRAGAEKKGSMTSFVRSRVT